MKTLLLIIMLAYLLIGCAMLQPKPEIIKGDIELDSPSVYRLLNIGAIIGLGLGVASWLNGQVKSGKSITIACATIIGATLIITKHGEKLAWIGFGVAVIALAVFISSLFVKGGYLAGLWKKIFKKWGEPKSLV